MEPSNELVIQTKGLSKAYGGVPALKSLDLKVHKNSIFGFLGPNGAGKTTTIRLLLGLARPSSGSGTVFGKDIVRDSVEIRKRVGYLAQEPHYYEYMTAREVLRFTASFFYAGPQKKVDKRIEETLGLVGLEGKADRPIKGFSGGERQRLGIGQAQINYPDLLILDEPAASLDPQGRHDVLGVMERLRKYTTIFYSTHILGDVQRVSDSVAILDRGCLIAQAPIEELLAGKQSPVYMLAFKGQASGVRDRLSRQAWVKSIEETRVNGHVSCEVTVTDEAAAEAQLLRLALSDAGVTVTEFGRKKMDLEDVFLGLTEGDNRDKR